MSQPRFRWSSPVRHCTTKRPPSDSASSVTKGALGGLVFITDDARALYDELRERGVTDFTQEPTDHFYGIDMGVRDPFGNHIRFLQQGTAGEQEAD